MRVLFLKAFTIAALIAFAGVALGQNVESSSPDGMIKAIMSRIMSDPAVQSGDRGQLTEVVEQDLLPYMDLRRATQLATGRAWRTASPQQQQQLVGEFTLLLTRTYARALAQSRGSWTQKSR